MRGFGGKELGAKVSDIAVGVTALAGLAEFELCMRGEEALVVGWAAEGFFADGLRRALVIRHPQSKKERIRTGLKVGLCAVVILSLGACTLTGFAWLVEGKMDGLDELSLKVRLSKSWSRGTNILGFCLDPCTLSVTTPAEPRPDPCGRIKLVTPKKFTSQPKRP